MYNFFYKEDGYINKLTLGLALLGVAGLITGLIFLASPTVKAVKNIIASQPKKMKLIVIKPKDCADCFDVYQVTDFIKETLQVQYSKQKEYQSDSANAELLINTYKIEALPTFILQGDIKNSKLGELFDESSIAFSDDKTFVYSNKFPPLYTLKDQQVKGRFSLTYLADKSCDKCYDVYLHNTALENLIMKPSASSTVDISSDEGKKLISDYKIQYVPTIILKGDLGAYESFAQVWETVGTIEKDGAYVFREKGLNVMGAYKNLWTGKIQNEK